jgi:hypothetical protein
MPDRRSPRHSIAGFIMMRAPVFVGVALACTTATIAATLGERAKEAGCVNKPVWQGGELYRCATQSGVFSYFNVPEGNGKPAAGSSSASSSTSTPKAPTPASFPRVDPETQKGRDGVRRKVLAEELASEEKLLTESRAAYADGAPPALPEEKADAEKYRARLGRLKQSVAVHEKNVEALKKELAAVK